MTTAPRPDRALAVRSALQALSQEQRTALELAYFEGLSQAKIAKRVGISQIHVSRLTRRALAKLRAEIGAEAA